MSVIYCEDCDKQIDLDFNAEHLQEHCKHERTRISHSDSGGKDREYWECLDCGENEEL